MHYPVLGKSIVISYTKDKDIDIYKGNNYIIIIYIIIIYNYIHCKNKVVKIIHWLVTTVAISCNIYLGDLSCIH